MADGHRAEVGQLGAGLGGRGDGPRTRTPRAVVFDLDDTLYAERRFALSGYAAVAARVASTTGIPAAVLFRFMARRFRSHGRDGLLQALCAAYALPIDEVPDLVAVIRTHRPRLRLPGPARDVLVRLRASGHRLGVLTNGLPGTQRAKVEALGLASLVDEIVYAHDVAPAGKPARVCFVAVLARLGVESGAAVFVGDHPANDVAGAAAAGLRTIWLRGRRSEPAPPNAHGIARALTDVPGLVARLLEDSHVAAC